MSSLDSLATPALIKRINSLAEEAGALCVRHGLALAPPAAVLTAAENAGLSVETQQRLNAIFDEIAAGKALLAARRVGEGQLPTKRR